MEAGSGRTAASRTRSSRDRCCGSALLSLLALAMSAWVQWRIAASALIVGIFFVAAGFGQAFNAVLRTYWGYLLNLSYLIKIVWEDLFDMPAVAKVSSRGDVPWQEMDHAGRSGLGGAAACCASAACCC